MQSKSKKIINPSTTASAPLGPAFNLLSSSLRGGKAKEELSPPAEGSLTGLRDQRLVGSDERFKLFLS